MAFLEDKLQISLKKGLGMSEIYSWVSEIFDVIYLFKLQHPTGLAQLQGEVHKI